MSEYLEFLLAEKRKSEARLAALDALAKDITLLRYEHIAWADRTRERLAREVGK